MALSPSSLATPSNMWPVDEAAWNDRCVGAAGYRVGISGQDLSDGPFCVLCGLRALKDMKSKPSILGIEPVASYVLGKSSTTEPHPQL